MLTHTYLHMLYPLTAYLHTAYLNTLYLLTVYLLKENLAHRTPKQDVYLLDGVGAAEEAGRGGAAIDGRGLEIVMLGVLLVRRQRRRVDVVLRR